MSLRSYIKSVREPILIRQQQAIKCLKSLHPTLHTSANTIMELENFIDLLLYVKDE